jgi:ABC-type branched-subunit amino acid transport system ATPase component/MFS family permease
VIEMLIPPAKDDGRTRSERFKFALRHPKVWLSDVTGGGDIFPMVLLFGISFFEVIDRSTAGLLTPDLQDAFGLTTTGITSIISLSLFAGLALTVPIALYADRFNRTRLMLLGAAVFTLFSFGTGMIPTIWILLLVMRSGTAVGQATIFPTHNSLLTDYYDIPYRPRVFSFHAAAQGLGLFIGPILAGVLATNFGWRVPFLVLPLPGVLLIIWGLKLKEPKRGHFERKAMGANEALSDVQEPPPSLEESWRMVWRIDSLRRIYYSIPFLAVAFIGLTTLANLFYQREFGLDPAQRGFIEAVAEPFQLVGLALSAIFGTRMLRKGPSHVIRFVSWISGFAALMILGFALSPNVLTTVLFRIAIAIPLAAVLPSVFAALSLAIPARARSSGFSIAVVFALPGLLLLPFTGWVMDNWGPRWGMALTAPVFLIAGVIISSAHKVIDKDIKNVWTSTAARSELLYDRQQGTIKQLLVRSLDVRYGEVQVLFNVDFEVDEGEMVALLGTNGAGKSTLLKSICGVVQASNGAVIFDGRDVTDAPPHEIANLGVAMVPGGQGVFPSLTVRENLKVAQWMDRRSDRAKERYAKVLAIFPVLTDRMDDPAANLSGGQQQMLALGMAFLSEPKLLVIDELSLGLAPVIVEQLVEIVRAINDGGTTVILVEQSVNVALTLAERAYFMEKGEIRFEGPTAELLDRPDVLRSVFLEGASKGMAMASGASSGAHGNGNGHNGPAGHPSVPATAGVEDNGNGTGSGAAPDNGATPALDERIVVGEVRTDGPPEVVTPGLGVDGLFVRFGGIVAVDDVTFDVAPGEILGIIGPNGAGKTTMFDLISGFTSADAGQVVLQGQDISSKSPDRRARLGLGRSFQDARLFPALTVEETIAVATERWVEVKDPFNAALRLPAQQDSEAKVREQVDEMIALMGIESFRSKFVRELSTGSRRVVDMACVLTHRPSVVLLDEPSSGIAQREAEALSPLLLRIRDTLGASLLVIEHDMPLITSVADRMLALDQGHVIALGEPSEVLSHPEVVSSYLGNSPGAIARSGAR